MIGRWSATTPIGLYTGRITEAADDRKVVCYYANWAVFRKDKKRFSDGIQ